MLPSLGVYALRAWVLYVVARLVRYSKPVPNLTLGCRLVLGVGV